MIGCSIQTSKQKCENFSKINSDTQHANSFSTIRSVKHDIKICLLVKAFCTKIISPLNLVFLWQK